MILAAVGIDGVVSYFISHRTRNIGARIALGANTRTVLGVALRSALRMILLGIVIGEKSISCGRALGVTAQRK